MEHSFIPLRMGAIALAVAIFTTDVDLCQLGGCTFCGLANRCKLMAACQARENLRYREQNDCPACSRKHGLYAAYRYRCLEPNTVFWT